MEIGITTVAGIAMATYVAGLLTKQMEPVKQEPDEVVVVTTKTYKKGKS